jgi:hypothetical protein
VEALVILANLCPYCERPRRSGEPTCGKFRCIGKHVEAQHAGALRAEHEQDLGVEIRSCGFRCDCCGHEQEADVACDACGNHGVVSFGFAPTKPASVRLPYRCGSCGHEQENDAHCQKCNSLDVSARASSLPPPSGPDLVSAIAASIGVDEATVRLVFELERVLRGQPLLRQQHALASALWRTVTQNPTLASSLELFVSEIRLRDGGRRINIDADLVPPREGP